MRQKRVFAGSLTVGLLILIVLGVTALPYIIASDEARRPYSEPHIVVLDLPSGTSIESLQRVRVHHVLDGDTIDVMFDDGRVNRVRYFGVDTPERGTKCYREAIDRNDSLLNEYVYLLEDERLIDQYDRLLRYIFLEDGTSIDATLVAEGWGEAWDRDGRYRDEIVALEQEAREAERGCIWN